MPYPIEQQVKASFLLIQQALIEQGLDIDLTLDSAGSYDVRLLVSKWESGCRVSVPLLVSHHVFRPENAYYIWRNGKASLDKFKVMYHRAQYEVADEVTFMTAMIPIPRSVAQVAGISDVFTEAPASSII